MPTITIPDDFTVSFKHKQERVIVCTKGCLDDSGKEIDVVFNMSRKGARLLSHYLKVNS